MIVLSVGMPRAGSGWYYNLSHDLIVAAGGQDARSVRQKYYLQGVLTEVNCNIGALTLRRLLSVWIPSLMGNTFVVKAHSAPTTTARAFLRLGWMQAAYIYRDPRDAMLSAYENGQRALQKGRPNAFSGLVDFETALVFIKQYVGISEAWLALPQVLHTRYENLLGDYEHESRRLVEFFHLDTQSPALAEVMKKYKPERAAADQKGIHFSKGKVGRFREKMPSEQQQVLEAAFGSYLERMGYSL